MKNAIGSIRRAPLAALIAVSALLGCVTSSKRTPSNPSRPLDAGQANPLTDSGDNASPRVATDGAGIWIVAWHSSDTLGGVIGDDFDILFSRSTDDGASWIAPAALNTNAATDSGHDFRPHVATDGKGRWVAVWESEDTLGGTVGPDTDIFVSRSIDNGVTWTAPAPLNSEAGTDLGDDGSARIATDGKGRWIAVWAAEDLLGGPYGNDSDILVARSTDDGAAWTAPAPLNANAAIDVGFDMHPRVATDGKGHWVALWQSYDSLGGTIGEDADILVARSTDDGATWTAPAPLNANAATDADYDMNVTIATDRSGRWVVAWVLDDAWRKSGATDIDLRVARSMDDGASWTPPAPLNVGAATDAVNDEAPELATDRAGHWIAVWQSNHTSRGTVATTFRIVVARSTDDGATWSAPAPITSSSTSTQSSRVRP